MNFHLIRNEKAKKGASDFIINLEHVKEIALLHESEENQYILKIDYLSDHTVFFYESEAQLRSALKVLLISAGQDVVMADLISIKKLHQSPDKDKIKKMLAERIENLFK